MTIPLFSQIELNEVGSGFSNPIAIVNDGQNDDVLYIVEQGGSVYKIDPYESSIKELFLTLENINLSQGGEKGLLGMCFHPDFPNSPYIYINYNLNTSSSDFSTIIARYEVNLTTNNVIDTSEFVLMDIPQPYRNHNGGDLKFGPDGYLYIALGDGGSGGDPEGRSQDRLNFLGKMLRIDVNVEDGSNKKYLIPDTNPFAFDDFTLDEIWALGLRNPWRFNFDAETGDLFIGDVGQNSWEEINLVVGSSIGGENYGWNCFEGFEPFRPSDDCPSDDVKPIHVYETRSSDGCSVTGGYVVRDKVDSPLYGKYIFGDFCSGNIWVLEENLDGVWVQTLVHKMDGGELSTFGEDTDGNIYLASHSEGKIYLISKMKSNLQTSIFSNFRIFPNPVHDNLHVKVDFTFQGSVKAKLYNAQGQILYIKEFQNLQSIDESIDMNGLPTGNYYFTLQSKNGAKTWQLNKME